MVPLKLTFVAAILLASIMDQVYSRECYECVYYSVTGKDQDCKEDPVQSKYVKTCGSTKEAGVAPLTITAKADDYKCGVFQGESLGHAIFARGCIESSLDCETVKDVLPVKVEKCSICDGDLCNASSKAGITIFTLIFCFTSYLIFQ